jgi:phospholipase/carboxylesterase
MLRLTARPDASAPSTLPAGTSPVRLAHGAGGLLHVPSPAARGLVVALHGAGGHARAGLDLLLADADRVGLVVLAPSSAGTTWGAVRGGSDPDTPALASALSDLFTRHPLDPERVAVAGFSDGGSCALTLGLSNGDVFRRVVAFSPGFEAAPERRGRPQLFVTHGVADAVLPIDRTARRVVRALAAQEYDVTYREFDGGHVVPPSLAAEAAEWLMG